MVQYKSEWGKEEYGWSNDLNNEGPEELPVNRAQRFRHHFQVLLHFEAHDPCTEDDNRELNEHYHALDEICSGVEPPEMTILVVGD